MIRGVTGMGYGLGIPETGPILLGRWECAPCKRSGVKTGIRATTHGYSTKVRVVCDACAQRMAEKLGYTAEDVANAPSITSP